MPVLSSSTERASPSRSIVARPLTTTPARAARESPDISAIGAARISGHGVATTNTASARTGSPETVQAIAATSIVSGKEEQRVAVGDPYERRPLLPGLLDKPHERRVGALGRRAERAQLEGGACGRRAAADVAAAMDRDRQRLAGQRRLVDDRLVALDHPVDRHHLARAHEHDVVGGDLVDRHLHELIAAAKSADARGPLDQRRQLTPRPPVRRLLQRVPAREHQRNHSARQVLAESERARHRDERDRVDADVAAQQRAQRPRPVSGTSSIASSPPTTSPRGGACDADQRIPAGAAAPR